jgi:hypothetical protein
MPAVTLKLVPADECGLPVDRNAKVPGNCFNWAEGGTDDDDSHIWGKCPHAEQLLCACDAKACLACPECRMEGDES